METGTRWIFFVKILDCVGCICQNSSWLPRTVKNVVADPADMVFQLAAPKSGVGDRIDLKILHTVHLDCGGGATIRLGKGFATWGSRRLTWKTGWILMAEGKARRNANDPICSRIENGPSRRTSILLEGRVVCMWRRSSHTFWPTTRFGAARRRLLAERSIASLDFLSSRCKIS